MACGHALDCRLGARQVLHGQRTPPSSKKEHAKQTVRAVLPNPDKAGAALNRIEIPQDAVERIAQLLTPGSSLIISVPRYQRRDGRTYGFHRADALTEGLRISSFDRDRDFLRNDWGLERECLASPSTSWSVCLPGGKSMRVSVWPAPKWRWFLSCGMGSLDSKGEFTSTSR